jgi:hypothetical protein
LLLLLRGILKKAEAETKEIFSPSIPTGSTSVIFSTENTLRFRNVDQPKFETPPADTFKI